MPPTLKDSSGLTTSTEKPERAAENGGGNQEGSAAQPVALEVPVTVNGARAVEGKEKREPFSETTSTVLVKANGAVIRLSAVVEPGQLLFLTNEKTKKEVVCQVVKSRNSRNVSGYVELEFTEPVLGFWGMRFPGERTAVSSIATSLPERKSESLTASSADAIGKSADVKPTTYTDARPAATSVTSNLADAVEEFKTEIKADSRPTSKADFLAPAESSLGAKLESTQLQEQLTALLLAEQKENDAKPATSIAPPSADISNAAEKILEMGKDEPQASKIEVSKPEARTEASTTSQSVPQKASGTAKSSFESEEVAIPSWLEPLARNAAVKAPAAEDSASDSGLPGAEWRAPSERETVAAQKQPASTEKRVSSAARHTPTAPVFGNTLLGESTHEVMRSSGRGKGMWIGIAAALIAAAASGAWYFRDSLGVLSNAPATSTSTAVPEAAANRESSASALPPAGSPEPDVVASKPDAANSSMEKSAPTSTLTQGKMQAATITERIPKAGSAVAASSVPANSIEVVEPGAKKPSLGTVRLAKPKLGRTTNLQANGETAPTLELNNETLSAESGLSAGLGESSKQPAAPAAPVVVGGDVTAARMISSVPPVYPTLAKNQHITGDVRIDALIDASGRVTTMKVMSGPALLHQAAMDALRQWKYKAATLNGNAVPMHLTVTIQFRLQ